MKTAKEYAKSIKPNRANIEYILVSNDMNGSLLVDIQAALKQYGKQCAEQALKDAADKITVGQTIAAIQKSIRNTEIKLL